MSYHRYTPKPHVVVRLTPAGWVAEVWAPMSDALRITAPISSWTCSTRRGALRLLAEDWPFLALRGGDAVALLRKPPPRFSMPQ